MMPTSEPISRLHRTETVAMERQNRISHDPGQERTDQHRDVEEQIERDDRTEKFREIGRHRTELADDPHSKRDRFGHAFSSEFRQVLSRDDAELGRKPLKEHRHADSRARRPRAAGNRTWRRPEYWSRSFPDLYMRRRRQRQDRQRATARAIRDGSPLVRRAPPRRRASCSRRRRSYVPMRTLSA